MIFATSSFANIRSSMYSANFGVILIKYIEFLLKVIKPSIYSYENRATKAFWQIPNFSYKLCRFGIDYLEEI